VTRNKSSPTTRSHHPAAEPITRGASGSRKGDAIPLPNPATVSRADSQRDGRWRIEHCRAGLPRRSRGCAGRHAAEHLRNIKIGGIGRYRDRQGRELASTGD